MEPFFQGHSSLVPSYVVNTNLPNTNFEFATSDIESLPQELLVEIFKSLSVTTFNNTIPLVSRRFYQVSFAPEIAFKHLDGISSVSSFETLKLVCKAGRQIRQVNFHFSIAWRIRDYHIHRLVANCPQIETLNIRACGNLSLQSLQSLKSLKGMKRLELRLSSMNEDRILEALDHLSDFESVHSLELGIVFTKNGDEILSRCARLPNLTLLDLSECNSSRLEILQRLLSAPGLKKLIIVETMWIGMREVAELRKVAPFEIECIPSRDGGDFWSLCMPPGCD